MIDFNPIKAQRQTWALRRKIKQSRRRGWKKVLLLLLLLLLIWIGAGLTGRVPKGWPNPGKVLAEALGLAPGSCSEEGEEPLPVPKGELKVHFLDVGQADCILLETQGRYLMIDAGKREDFTVIDGYLKEKGVERLEMLWLTHPHEDHIGSASCIVANYEVGGVYLREEDFDAAGHTRWRENLVSRGIPCMTPEVGREVMFGACRLQVLGPVTGSENENNRSLVVKVRYGETSFLFTGDAEWEEEYSILNNGCNVTADVLKVGHHGSDTSTSYYFLREVDPSYAIISVGNANDYGHPHEKVLSRLEDAEVTVYRTDARGTIVAVSDGHSVSFPGID